MCFSATASFVAAAVTGSIGVATLARARHRSELPLASIPLLFAVQQAIEGTLWLVLAADTQAGLADALTYGFLLLAEVWWPLFVPIAVLLVEPVALRRRLMLPALALGIVVGLYLLSSILSLSHHAAILEGHLVYVSERPYSFALAAAYFIATVAPPLLSSRRAVALLGLVVCVGAGIAYVLYWEAFVSVWCFFAAAASGVILMHFVRERQRERGVMRA